MALDAKLRPKRLTTVCLSILLPILLLLVGGDLVKRDTEERCILCESRHFTTHYSWCLWGANGSTLARDDWQPSIVFEDFPEARCEHLVETASDEVRHPWNGPLFKAASTFYGRGAGTSYVPNGFVYANEPSLRAAIRDLLEKGTVSRSTVAAWLSSPSDTRRLTPETREEWYALQKLYESTRPPEDSDP